MHPTDPSFRLASFRPRPRPARGLAHTGPIAEALEPRALLALAYAMTDNNLLVSFDTAAPGTLLAAVPITGLQNTENIEGIDFRPANGRLYGVGRLGTEGRLYQINHRTGAATLVGSAPFSSNLTGSRLGFDFNPSVDRLRIVTDTDVNIRVNPDTGVLVANDTPITPAGNLVGAAYSNNVAGTVTTVLWAIDSATDRLVTVNPPNVGIVLTVGDLGVNASDAVAFDIVRTDDGADAAFATLSVGPAISLYSINLTTGAATKVGDVGNNSANIVGLAVAFPQHAPVIVTAGGELAHPDILEDSGAGSGISVTDLLAARTGFITDEDAFDPRGVAVVGVTGTKGTWQYTTDDGATWLDFGTVFDGAARLLAPTDGTRIRYTPNANASGAPADTLTVRAWDQTSGANGARVDVSANGGTTAFSANTGRVFVTVTEVNDLPSISGTSAERTIRNNQTVRPFQTVSIGDADAAQSLTVEVRLDRGGRGAFTAGSLLNSGFVKVSGRIYRFMGTAAQATTAIRKIRFDPTDGRVAPGQTERTKFTIAVNDGAVLRRNSQTRVVSQQV